MPPCPGHWFINSFFDWLEFTHVQNIFHLSCLKYFSKFHLLWVTPCAKIHQDWETPIIFAEGQNAELDKYITFIERIEEYQQRLAALLNKTPGSKNLCRMVNNSTRLSDSKQWMPAALKYGSDETPVRPEELDNFGGPWLLGSNKMVTRCGPSSDPFHLLSHIIVNLDKPILVATWPLKSLLNVGESLNEGLNFLSKANAKDAEKWTQNNIMVGVIPPKGHLWMPIGWGKLVVPLSDGETFCVHQTIVCSGLFKAQDEKLRDGIAKNLFSFYNNTDTLGPMAKLAPAFKSWLKYQAPQLAISSKSKDGNKSVENRGKKTKDKDNDTVKKLIGWFCVCL